MSLSALAFICVALVRICASWDHGFLSHSRGHRVERLWLMLSFLLGRRLRGTLALEYRLFMSHSRRSRGNKARPIPHSYFIARECTLPQTEPLLHYPHRRTRGWDRPRARSQTHRG